MFGLIRPVLLATQVLIAFSSSIVLRDYGVYPVGDYDTVMTFYFNFYNTGPDHNGAVVKFEKCCLVIAENDVDCDIMELADQHAVRLGPYSPETVVFRFHSYYVHDRVGHCEFMYDRENSHSWTPVRVDFKTSPWPAEKAENDNSNSHRKRRSAGIAKNAFMKCDGVDEDPQWYCQPADCVLKYKGKRNYYNNVTKKCEPVVKCKTRGPTGELIAYYEPETNECHNLKLPNGNETVEVKTEVLSNGTAPNNRHNATKSNSTQHASGSDVTTKKSMAHEQKKNEKTSDDKISKENKTEEDTVDLQLECNHGAQINNECKCHDGWMTAEPDWSYARHWCSEPASLTDDMTLFGWYFPSKHDAILVIVLSVVAAVLIGSWMWLLVRCAKLCLQKARLSSQRNGSGHFTLLSDEHSGSDR